MSRRRLFLCILTLAVLLSGTGASAQEAEQPAPPPPCDVDCRECHDVDVPAFRASAHGILDCSACHSGITDAMAHAEGKQTPGTPYCAGCHEDVARQYDASVHRKQLGFECTACHDQIHQQSRWDRKKVGIIALCTKCHETSTYVQSDHSAAVLRGNEDSAACADCHGLHDTKNLHYQMDRFPEEARVFYNAACRRCHGDKDMMRRNRLTTEAVDTYDESYHGKVQKLGYPTHVAGCADCHAYHNILLPDDPRSTINPANLVKNCGRCHERVNANFVKFIPHADYRDSKRHPYLFGTFLAMSALLVVTLAVFWTHTLLWWRKTYWDKRELIAKGQMVEPDLMHMDNPGQSYWRFKPFARVMHIILLFSFFGLVSTGFPLKFSDAKWAPVVIRFLGGAQIAGQIHRAAAGALIVLFLGAALFSIVFLSRKKYGATFWDRLFSPDSLFFRKKDIEDFVGMAKWFFNKGEKPKFDRWTYWEKFDFLAVFWGMAAIGLSGAFLWLPEVTSQFLPGWVFNVAIIIHSDEALLAAGFIFTVHFFNTHLIPTKFPMDTAVFTGRILKYHFIEERPLYYERLERLGKLKRLEAKPASIPLVLFSQAVGMGSILVGLAVMALAILHFIL